MSAQPPLAKKNRPRSDLFTITAHLVLIAALAVSGATGLAIALDSRASIAGFLAATFEMPLPRGTVIEWHLAAGVVVGCVAVAYGLFFTLTQRRRRHSLRFWSARAWRDRGMPVERRTDAAARLRNSVVIYLGCTIIVGLILTGLLLYWSGGSPLPNATVAFLHGGLTVAMLGYVALHLWSQANIGGLLRILRPRVRQVVPAALVTTAALVVAGVSLGVDRSMVDRLHVPAVADMPVLDGDASDLVWQDARAVRVATVRGANFEGGATEVELRAVHDGTSIAFLITWDDATESNRHLPLIREADGWRIDMQGFAFSDETKFYEDKLALLFARSPAIGSGTARLGTGLVDGPHRPGARGLHFSDGETLDLWHWKSLRTGMQSPGFADDNHIGPPIPSVNPGRRYTGGYQPDDGASGYHLNLCLADDADCRQTVARVRETGIYEPVPGSADDRLARCLARGNACWRFLVPIYAPPDDQPWTGVVRPESAVLYDPAADNHPVGTRIPGVLIHDRLTKDRSDVRAAGRWRNGRWSLELQRSLATGSDKDLAFRVGEPVYLWVAAFDASQTRHTRHLHPVVMTLFGGSDQRPQFGPRAGQ